MSFWYLATPYAKYPRGPLAAFEAAIEQAALLIHEGILVFCPIVHSHYMHKHIKPLDAHRFWLSFDRTFMEVSRGLIVCELLSWRESRGMLEEVLWFTRNSKPIVYMTPGKVPEELLQ